MVAVLNAIDETKADKSYVDEQVGSIDIPEQIQANLSETDETSKAYVSGIVQQRHLPEGYPYGDKLISIAENKEITTEETMPTGYIAAGEDNVLEENKKYCVVFNGVEYDNLICQKSSNKFYLGSIHPLTDSSSYPFCIWTNYTLNRDIRIDTKEFGTYVVSLHYYEDIPMDERYIPESLKQSSNLSETDSTSKAYVDGVLQNRHLPNGYPHIEKTETEIFPLTTKRMGGSKEPFFTLHYYTDVSTKINLVEGNKYTVIFDGTAYDCVCSSESVEGVGYLWLSTEAGKYDDDFVVAVIDTSPNKTRLCAKGYNSSRTYEIYSVEETIVPIAEKFIPDNVARLEDIPEIPKAVLYDEAQELTNEQKAQARENIGVEYTEDDAIEVLIETGIINPATDSDGTILTDENGKIILL